MYTDISIPHYCLIIRESYLYRREHLTGAIRTVFKAIRGEPGKVIFGTALCLNRLHFSYCPECNLKQRISTILIAITPNKCFPVEHSNNCMRTI